MILFSEADYYFQQTVLGTFRRVLNQWMALALPHTRIKQCLFHGPGYAKQICLQCLLGCNLKYSSTEVYLGSWKAQAASSLGNWGISDGRAHFVQRLWTAGRRKWQSCMWWQALETVTTLAAWYVYSDSYFSPFSHPHINSKSISYNNWA